VLHERDDFADLLTTVGEQTGAGAALIEKDQKRVLLSRVQRGVAVDASERGTDVMLRFRTVG
jgi:hypothetical protein